MKLFSWRTRHVIYNSILNRLYLRLRNVNFRTKLQELDERSDASNVLSDELVVLTQDLDTIDSIVYVSGLLASHIVDLLPRVRINPHENFT